ncbi:MAG TPA: hypothetical protein DEF47_22955 [Herpetosiphon sp.]|uniref:Uncharacterized protein n=1 Tax=Herpetosiphon aurantiacus (strain ATCC 23779 / DSM 785 / 114-95) TaxID=316274 RepID=A9B2F6_HERA2|nr:hypothetical protein [Herpetosiphon sp.]ABX04001.1 hypothetical protein Haur_1356 [Herpetosiphon aurantiacus DSM 785]HBW52750.1 hypothetical protein [Herpetosiphon sp.]
MGNIGNGEKAAGATVAVATVEPSTNSVTSAKRPTKRTNNAVLRQIKPVSQQEALEMLRSALVYLQLSGVQARYRTTEVGLLLQLDAVYLDGVRFAVRDCI